MVITLINSKSVQLLCEVAGNKSDKELSKDSCKNNIQKLENSKKTFSSNIRGIMYSKNRKLSKVNREIKNYHHQIYYNRRNNSYTKTKYLFLYHFALVEKNQINYNVIDKINDQNTIKKHVEFKIIESKLKCEKKASTKKSLLKQLNRKLIETASHMHKSLVNKFNNKLKIINRKISLSASALSHSLLFNSIRNKYRHLYYTLLSERRKLNNQKNVEFNKFRAMKNKIFSKFYKKYVNKSYLDHAMKRNFASQARRRYF